MYLFVTKKSYNPTQAMQIKGHGLTVVYSFLDYERI